MGDKMGIFQMQTWQCKSCGYEFEGYDGFHESDPNDIGTTHFVEPYHCKKCGNVKNVSRCASPYEPKPGNEELCQYDSSVCENCGVEMQTLEKTRFKFFKRYYKCPNCGKKTFRFVEEDECWT